MKKNHNASFKKDNYGRFCIDWDELPSKWKKQGGYQELLSVFLRDCVKPLLKNVNYLCKDDRNAYVDNDVDNLYQKLANLNHKVVFCNTELSRLPSNAEVESCKDNFDLVAYVVRAGKEGEAGHFYARVKYEGDWYKSRCNGKTAVRKIGSMQKFREKGEFPSKVVPLVYYNK